VPSARLARARTQPVDDVTPNWGGVDTELEATITPDASTPDTVLFNLTIQASDAAAPSDEGWYTIAAITDVPAFFEARDGSLRSPRVGWASSKVSARFLRLVIRSSARARWGAAIEVV
jgi:hypothetical protein